MDWVRRHRGTRPIHSPLAPAGGGRFVREDRRREAVDRALAALGSFSPEEADRLEEEVEKLRRSWR